MTDFTLLEMDFHRVVTKCRYQFGSSFGLLPGRRLLDGGWPCGLDHRKQTCEMA